MHLFVVYLFVMNRSHSQLCVHVVLARCPYFPYEFAYVCAPLTGHLVLSCQAEAIILAIAGGSDLLQRTQQVFFQEQQSRVAKVSKWWEHGVLGRMGGVEGMGLAEGESE